MALSKLKSAIKQVMSSSRKKWSHYQTYKSYSRQWKNYLLSNGFQNDIAEGENQYIRKWQQLYNKVEPYSYRYFSHFCGNTPDIVPNDIGCNIIEEVLNPLVYRPVYSDKNFFPIIMGGGFYPKQLRVELMGVFC